MDTIAKFQSLIADLSAKMNDFQAKTASDNTSDAALKDAQAAKDATAKDLVTSKAAVAASFQALVDFEKSLGVLSGTTV